MRCVTAQWDPGGKRLNFFFGKHYRVYGGGRKTHTNWRGIPLSLNEMLWIWILISPLTPDVRGLRLARGPIAVAALGETRKKKKWWKSCICDLASGSGGWGRTGQNLSFRSQVTSEIMWLQGQSLFSVNHSDRSRYTLLTFRPTFSHSGFIVLSLFFAQRD